MQRLGRGQRSDDGGDKRGEDGETRGVRMGRQDNRGWGDKVVGVVKQDGGDERKM